MSKFFLKYCLLIIIPIFLYSQEKDYRIEYLTTNSGLSIGIINSITKKAYANIRDLNTNEIKNKFNVSQKILF